MLKAKVSGLLLIYMIVQFISGVNSPVNALNRVEKRQVIILFVDGLSFQDFQQLSTYPHVDKWIEKGDYAALSIRPPGARTLENGYVVMGSGGQALYYTQSGTAYHPYEMVKPWITAQEQMIQMSGNRKYEHMEEGIIFPGIFKLRSSNEGKPYQARIGLLGSLVEEAGLQMSLYGNGDTGADDPRRQAVLFAMNKEGYIPKGDISTAVNTPEATYPYGLKTNYSYIDQQLNKQQSGVTVVELADVARLYSMRQAIEPNYFQQLHSKILSDIDTFIGSILERRSPDQMVMLLSPATNDVAKNNHSLLTPLVIWKENSRGTELSSATTRQPGIVSGLDVAPTILSWLSIPTPKELLGHVMVKTNREKETSVFSHMDKAQIPAGDEILFPSFLSHVVRIEHIYANRPAVMYTYVMLQVVVLIAAFLLWIGKKRTSQLLMQHTRKVVRIALLALLFFPTLFLLEPLLAWSVPSFVVLGMMIFLAFSVSFVIEKWRLPKLLFAMAGITVLVILLDGFTGAMAMKRSYMGYDPVIGARFYGLGNEFEGVLIGASILVIASLYEWWNEKKTAHHAAWRFWVAVAGFSIILYYMASPSFGTNAGGFLAGTIGFSIALLRLQGWKVGKKGFFFISGSLVAAIVILIAGNLFSTQPLTHVGRVAEDMITGNWVEVWNIIQRKLEMNIKLIRVSAWSKVFLVSLFILSILSLRSEHYLRDLSHRYPYLTQGFGGIVAGSMAGLVLNDSGIISAATSIVFFVVPALYVALQEEAEPHIESP